MMKNFLNVRYKADEKKKDEEAEQEELSSTQTLWEKLSPAALDHSVPL